MNSNINNEKSQSAEKIAPKQGLLERFDNWSQKVMASTRPTAKNGIIFGVLFLGLLAVSILVAYNTDTRRQAAVRDGASQVESVVKKIMVLNYNPIIESDGNKRLNEVMGWNDATQISSNIISDITEASGGYVNYVITENVVVDDFPHMIDGFQFSDELYTNCYWDNSCPITEGFDYLNALSEYEVCAKRNSGIIDEVWIWGGAHFGLYESRLAGPGAFWYNSPPLTGSECDQLLPIMGLNYERTEHEALHSYGHRVESSMIKVYEGWDNTDPDTDWDRFTLIDNHPVGPSQCGNVHFPPNGTGDYDYANASPVESACDNWLAFPNVGDGSKTITCEEWSCDQREFLKWWMEHMPNVTGYYDKALGNWWKYVVDYEAAKEEEGLYVKSYQVESGADDVNVGCGYYENKNEIYIGSDQSCSPNQTYFAGLRFDGISLSRGQQIEEAYLLINVDGPTDVPLNLIIQAEDSGNPGPFSGEHRPDQVVLTSSLVEWSLVESWGYDYYWATVDFAPVIQELVNRRDWQSGNSINIVLSYAGLSGDRRFFAYERDPYKAPVLKIVPLQSPSTSPSPSPTPSPPSASPSPSPSLEQACEDSGGVWKVFNNSCADNCPYLSSHSTCERMRIYSCDCGDNACWDGSSCQIEPSPTPSPNPSSSPTSRPRPG